MSIYSFLSITLQERDNPLENLSMMNKIMKGRKIIREKEWTNIPK